MISRKFSPTRLLAMLVAAAVLVLPVAAITLTPGDASSAGATISNGDSVFIHGIATGQPQVGLQVWVVGPNYLKVSTISVNSDDSYAFELRPADTQNLAPGQYFVVVQHPMMNGRFDITYNPATGAITNQQLGNGGMVIFQISGSGSLQSPDAAYALVQAISSQNVDDTFATTSFTIRPPGALIDPIGDHVVGDTFTITGSTNLAAGDKLSVSVTSSSFVPTSKAQSGEFSGTSAVVTIVPGTNGLNQWSLDVDTSAWKPDEYIVTVSGVTISVTGSTTFSLLPSRPQTSVATPVITTIPPTVTEVSIPATTVPATLTPLPTRSPVSPVCILGALGIVSVGMRIRKKQ